MKGLLALKEGGAQLDTVSQQPPGVARNWTQSARNSLRFSPALFFVPFTK